MTPYSFLNHQANALDVLASSYNTPQKLIPFADACGIAVASPGKAVVTGMGKSGLIARKIAATLQSTGQPAAYLDPAAAAHGDMGIIQDHDFIIALSNSGMTAELMPVLEYRIEQFIPLIAITSALDSPLAEAADALLAYPDLAEGCPIGRAPMSSTLMQLAIGDCLAAMLMDKRGFTQERFLALHHGGYLGADIKASLCSK